MWQLDRTRTECIRISRLKALSDTDSLMLVYDEREQLRLACIKKFVLPVTEKFVTAFKCFLTIEGTHKHQRMRVIVLSNFLVLDMAIFGPSIHGSSTMLQAHLSPAARRLVFWRGQLCEGLHFHSGLPATLLQHRSFAFSNSAS